MSYFRAKCVNMFKMVGDTSKVAINNRKNFSLSHC